MEILDRLWGAHSRNLDRALDRASQRHGLLAGNLANVNTPGYRRQDLDFGIELEGAQRALRQPAAATRGGAVRLDGNGVDLEREVVAIGETELRYQVLADMAGRYFSGLRNVIREGR